MIRAGGRGVLALALVTASVPVSGEEPRVGFGVVEASEAARREPRSGIPWGIVISGAGLAAGVGVGMALKSEADERYDRYLASADPRNQQRWLDSAQRYDRATLIGWGLAQVSFVGLVYYLTRDRDRPLVPVQGEPLVEVDGDEVRVGIRVAP